MRGIGGAINLEPEGRSVCANLLSTELKNEKLRKEIGAKAQKTVRERFLLTRKIEQYLDLFSAFEPNFMFNHKRLNAVQGSAPSADVAAPVTSAR